MAQVLKGDNGLFRAALIEAGFPETAKGTIYNDNTKAKYRYGVRRLKLDRGSAVFDASQKKQKKLEKGLRDRFGDRIHSMYFTLASNGYGRYLGESKSFCIKLHDNV